MSLGSVTIRSPQRFPEHLDGSDTISISPLHQVEFKHPAYPAGFDTFLKLPAFDHPDGGLHYNTAKVACGIIAGNRWDGSFRTGTDEHDLHFEDDDIMPLGVYYFLLPGFRYDSADTSYPITPNFTEWIFPHRNLPANWRLPSGVVPKYPDKTLSQATVAVVLRDNDECRVTGREEQHDSAHIVPVEEDQWFHANRMTDYVLDPGRQSQSAISDVNNQLLLRRDLHQSFDKAKKFAFVPKKPCAGSSNMVTHLLSPSKEYGLLYHNTLTRSLDAVPREYLFARFAWAILPRVEPFLLCEIPRLLVTVANGQQVFKPDECKGFTVSRGKRSGTGSPKKRQRSKNAGDQKEQCDLDERDTKNVKVRRMMPVSTPSELALPIASGDPITTVKDKGKSSTTALAMEEDSASASYHPNAATTRPNQTTPSNTTRNDEFSDREYLYSIREHALQTERDKSDPYGEWNDEFEWAMDILRNEHSANNLRAWEDLDEARRILGEVDDSRDWVEYEDDRRHRCDVRQEQ